MDSNMKHPALVLGLYFPGIAILKHLNSLNINVTGVSYIKDVPGFKLKDIRVFKVPSPQKNEKELVHWLVHFSKKCNEIPVLFNTSDDFITFLAKHRHELEGYFLFPWSSCEISLQLTSKLNLAEIATKAEVKIPRTISIEDWDKGFLGDISYPCLIKPLFANEWRSDSLRDLVGFDKLLVVTNSIDMDKWVKVLKERKVSILVQELIPGKDQNLYYCVVYRGRDGELKRMFCGQKIRITPIHFGSASYVKTTDVYPFMDTIKRLLDSVDYHGSAGIEFKLDQRDGEYKLIEVNARFGLWDDLSIPMGSDVFLAYYQDMCGDNPQTKYPKQVSINWVSLSRDIPEFLNYIREGELDIISWLRSFQRPLKIAEYYPGELSLFINSVFGKFIRKLRRTIHV